MSMRLLIIGTLNGELINASRIAMNRGAAVTHAEALDQGMNVLRAKGADLVMIDVSLPVAELVETLARERMRLPVVACGTGTDARAAVAAIQAGAKEYIPLPPDADMIAAVIEAVAADNRSFIWRDPAMEKVVKLAEQVAVGGLDPDHRREHKVYSAMKCVALSRECAPAHRATRRNKPSLLASSGGVPINLLESELSVYEKGAFTGTATARGIGKFGKPAGGHPLLARTRCSGWIRWPAGQGCCAPCRERKVIDRVGGSKPVPVDIRIIVHLQPQSRGGR